MKININYYLDKLIFTTIEVDHYDYIKTIKDKIDCNIDDKFITYIFNKHKLEHDKTFAYYEILDNYTIDIIRKFGI